LQSGNDRKNLSANFVRRSSGANRWRRAFQPGMYFSFSIQQTVYFNSPLEFPTSVGIERKFLIRIEFQKKPHLA
jgi:hypothetical protein